MEMKRRNQASSSLLLWAAAVAALLSQSMAISAANFEDQKTYYSPDPNTPPVSHTPPAHGSGGGHAPPTPSHGGGSYGHTPPTPSHGGGSYGHTSPTPSHGGGSYGHTPPANCGNPPSGGHHHTTPSPPTGGGGGGYYHSPPTSTPTPTTPTPVITPPTTPTPVITPPTTPTPVVDTPPTVITPPTTPIDPGTPSTPGITLPSPPFSFDPNSPPFSCNYWRNHPTLIWGLFGWWGTTVGSAFGLSSLPGFGSSTNVLQALSNTRTDGLGDLYREGTAALLNSMAHTRFPFTTSQVRDSFVAALGSNKAAASQAQIFKRANEGRA